MTTMHHFRLQTFLISRDPKFVNTLDSETIYCLLPFSIPPGAIQLKNGQWQLKNTGEVTSFFTIPLLLLSGDIHQCPSPNFNATASITLMGEESNNNGSSESARNEGIQLSNLDTAVCCPSGVMEELLPRLDGAPAQAWTSTGEGVGGGLTAGSSTPLRGTTRPDSGVETSPCTNW